MNTTWAVVKLRPEEKNSGLYGISLYDLCDTGTADWSEALNKLSMFAKKDIFKCLSSFNKMLSSGYSLSKIVVLILWWMSQLIGLTSAA